MTNNKRFIYLSYFMDEFTPLYGGAKGVSVQNDRAIKNGDSANTKKLTFNNHSGTHVDYPNHFFDLGPTSEMYGPETWIFNYPHLIEMPAAESQILAFSQDQLDRIPEDADFIIIKTGFGLCRNEDKYFLTNPGLSPEMALQLKEQRPQIRAVGMDFISITSFQNRELGRIAHRAFLGGTSPVLLVEDMDLSLLTKSPKSLMCFPLMIKGLDGAPVTIIAITE